MTDYSFLDPRIDVRLARDIDAAEANKLEAYLDSLGNWTIGRGHLMPPVAPGRSWAGFTIIPSTSDRYFNDDLLNAISIAQRWPEYASCDTACRQNALEELAFNMAHKFEFWGPTIKLIEAQDWQGVHDHLLASLWAKEVGSVRSSRIANYFLTGQYPNGQ
jgi:GH24 family phage-related lysozyme (muramidase)